MKSAGPITTQKYLSHEEWLEYTRSNGLQAGDSRTNSSSESHCLAGHSVGQKVHFMPKPQDVLVQCPKCKTVETLQFVEDRLIPSQKFSQKDNRIYHACGSNMPCRLYSLS
jgi:hypothetical protein